MGRCLLAQMNPGYNPMDDLSQQRRCQEANSVSEWWGSPTPHLATTAVPRHVVYTAAIKAHWLLRRAEER